MTGRPVISAGLIVQLALVAHRPTAISFSAPSARGSQEEGTVPGSLKVQWLRWLSSQPRNSLTHQAMQVTLQWPSPFIYCTSEISIRSFAFPVTKA